MEPVLCGKEPVMVFMSKRTLAIGLFCLCLLIGAIQVVTAIIIVLLR
ncbi:hypothetical protein BLJAPNOD_06167 [Ensifer sp. M14]|nr:hypothetical protein BLJAPNOD_06167 [Ensifer sp. M14]